MRKGKKSEERTKNNDGEIDLGIICTEVNPNRCLKEGYTFLLPTDMQSAGKILVEYRTTNGWWITNSYYQRCTVFHFSTIFKLK